MPIARYFVIYWSKKEESWDMYADTDNLEEAKRDLLDCMRDKGLDKNDVILGEKFPLIFAEDIRA